MQNAAKISSIKMEIFDNKHADTNDREENIGEESEKNLDLSMADFYLYIVVITHMCWKKQDSTNYLESLVLSHLYHSLYTIDEINMINNSIYYDLNLFSISSKNIKDLEINIGISPGITDT